MTDVNTMRLSDDIIDQIKESQIKLGYARETVRLYYRADSFAALIGVDDTLSPIELVHIMDAASPLADSKLGDVTFGTHEDRVEVTVPPEGVEYVHREIPEPLFLTDLIELFLTNHHLGKDEVLSLFAKYSDDFICEDVPEEAGFDYAVYFKDPSIDSHYYCFKDEMGHVIYHRFVYEDYRRLMED